MEGGILEYQSIATIKLHNKIDISLQNACNSTLIQPLQRGNVYESTIKMMGIKTDKEHLSSLTSADDTVCAAALKVKTSGN